MLEKSIILVRGIPGSGKTSFAQMLGNGPVISADDYFMVKGKYMFDRSKLGIAHQYCQLLTERYMREGENRVYVANTFTTEKEMAPYFRLAKRYNYTIFTIIVENRHNSTNVHNVPSETLIEMKNRFNVKL